MLEMRISFIVVTCMLLINSISDLVRKEICLKLTLTAGIVGVIFQFIYLRAGLINVLLSLIPGVILLFLSVITKGKIGAGDGIVVLCIGIWSDLYNALNIVMTGMFLAALGGVVLFFLKSKVKELPFVPFLLAANMITTMVI